MDLVGQGFFVNSNNIFINLFIENLLYITISEILVWFDINRLNKRAEFDGRSCFFIKGNNIYLFINVCLFHRQIFKDKDDYWYFRFQLEAFSCGLLF